MGPRSGGVGTAHSTCICGAGVFPPETVYRRPRRWSRGFPREDLDLEEGGGVGGSDTLGRSEQEHCDRSDTGGVLNSVHTVSDEIIFARRIDEDCYLPPTPTNDLFLEDCRRNRSL